MGYHWFKPSTRNEDAVKRECAARKAWRLTKDGINEMAKLRRNGRKQMAVAKIHEFTWEGKEMEGTAMECSEICGSYPQYLSRQINHYKLNMTQAMEKAVRRSSLPTVKPAKKKTVKQKTNAENERTALINQGLFSCFLSPTRVVK